MIEQTQEKGFVLDRRNYFSHEANINYLSHSQIRAFQDCQNRWKAEYQDGDYETPKGEALHVGTYTDIGALEGTEALEAWEEENVEIVCQKNGKKRAAFTKADEMIKAVKSQSVLATYLSGERKVILTGRIHGLKFKGEVDALNHSEPRIVDLKTTADLREKSWWDVSWLPDRRAYFYDYYWLQLAIYRELYKQTFDKYPNCYIVGVSKQSPPDVELYRMNDIGRFNEEIAMLKPWIERIKAVETGEAGTTRCGKCEWCRISNRIVEPKVITGE